MGIYRCLKYGFVVSFILFFVSCKNEDKSFYEKIRNNDKCMIACTIKSGNRSPICIVEEKWYLFYIFKKHNFKIDDNTIINKIVKGPIEVPLKLYQYLYGWQILSQPRVDALRKVSIDKFFVETRKNGRYISPQAISNITSMEELYIIKVLFDNKILVDQDCETGYYFEIRDGSF